MAKVILFFLFCLAAQSMRSREQAQHSDLINCEGPGLGIKNFPATITVDGQPVTIYTSFNNNVYNLSPAASGCGINIRPGTLLLPGQSGQSGGSITYTFSAPVSNVQLALQAQNTPGINQLTVTAANGGQPVTPVLAVFNSSAEACPGTYTVLDNNIQAGAHFNAAAVTMVNIAGGYFTSLTLQNTSATNSRSWIDLRLCNMTADCRPPEKPVLGTVVQPARAGENGSFHIANYKAAYAYIVTPSLGVTQNKWKITAPADQTYSVVAIAGDCESEKSAPVTLASQPVGSVSKH